MPLRCQAIKRTTHTLEKENKRQIRKTSLSQEGVIMNLGLVVHYKNKFPKCQVKFDDSGLDVYSQDGKHLVCLKKNGAGQLVDM